MTLFIYMLAGFQAFNALAMWVIWLQNRHNTATGSLIGLVLVLAFISSAVALWHAAPTF